MSMLDGATLFHGFPSGFADFLFSLQFNSTIELLPENKPTYKQLITETLTQLFHTLMPIALFGAEQSSQNRRNACPQYSAICVFREPRR